MVPGVDQLKVYRLAELVNSLRDRLKEVVGSLGRSLARAGETLDKVRLGDARHLMARRPATALAAAAAIGVLIGLASRR